MLSYTICGHQCLIAVLSLMCMVLSPGWSHVPSNNMHLLTLLPPQLLRTHKRPQQYEEGSAPEFQHDASEPFIGRFNFEAIDNALSTIRSRFDQPGFQMYHKSENLLLKSIHNESVEEELRAVTSFNGVNGVGCCTVESAIVTSIKLRLERCCHISMQLFFSRASGAVSSLQAYSTHPCKSSNE